MTIAIGDTIPAANLMVMGESGPGGVTTSELFDGKKVLLFAVPGAFTPGCSMTHLPGYVAHADQIKAARHEVGQPGVKKQLIIGLPTNTEINFFPDMPTAAP